LLPDRSVVSAPRRRRPAPGRSKISIGVRSGSADMFQRTLAAITRRENDVSALLTTMLSVSE
jgi:hypothetical protein